MERDLMRQSIIDQWTDEQKYLVDHSMADMDKNYDAAMKLLRDKERPDRHNTRGSAHYAEMI
jgi:hypothetical protein